jgi:hypothetical protein
MADEKADMFGDPKDWLLIELSRGFCIKSSSDRVKKVRMRESTGEDMLNARADIRVKGDNDPLFGFVAIAVSCKIELPDGTFRQVTPDDVKKLFQKDIVKLSTAFAKLNTDSEEEASAFLAKLKTGAPGNSDPKQLPPSDSVP